MRGKMSRFIMVLIIAGICFSSRCMVNTNKTTRPLTPGSSCNYPFPQSHNFHHNYTPGCIRPDHLTQSELNNQIKRYYEYWKTNYLVDSSRTPGGYTVDFCTCPGHKNADPNPVNQKITVSEAHGYGMMIMALMAGYETGAKTYFDGMMAFYNDHRSQGNNHLMDWEIECDESSGDSNNSATDGDMDIAYAMVLAHCQWGSDGNFDYLAEARRIIEKGLAASCISKRSYNIQFGDWHDDHWQTRSSDWMAGHCRLYGRATSEEILWNKVVERIYSNISYIQTNLSPLTGLMPDFIEKNPPQTNENILEGSRDNDYSYNACRWPWRLGMDYAHYAENRALTALNTVIFWIKNKTDNDPAKIVDGYHLDGTDLGKWRSGAFIAPFAAGCVVDSAHQQYLNPAWDLMHILKEHYYSDTLNLLCQLFISGNWWKPGLNIEKKDKDAT